MLQLIYYCINIQLLLTRKILIHIQLCYIADNLINTKGGTEASGTD